MVNEILTENEIVVDGFICDAETGEVIRDAEQPKEDWRPTTRKEIERIFERMASADAEMLACAARLRMVQENIGKQQKKAAQKREWLEGYYGEAITNYAREALVAAGGKSKTLTLDHGKVSFRATKGTNTITDMEKAVEWAKRNLPEVVRVKEDVLVSALLDGIHEKNASVDAQFMVEPTALPFIESTGPRESVSIETGVKG